MQPNHFSREELAGIHRFAVLLSGERKAAEAAVLEVFSEAAAKLDQIRNGKNCKAWLMAKLRNRLLKGGDAAAATQAQNEEREAAGLNPGAAGLAQRFCKMPEPGRSALALLYTDLFSATEIAQILQIGMDQLPGALDSGRAFLGQQSP